MLEAAVELVRVMVQVEQAVVDHLLIDERIRELQIQAVAAEAIGMVIPP